ncbi:protein Ycf2 isoform X2 [Oncorhynchus mykiss]|uniref:protein Ycf2 isoform X2 n=1 Tax=Oncorhynchus mykiss TaxID=8022 RepID=UPI001877C392|nr:protein Ycf2 isoform X2 [Oncorhynchus mykiss]
MSSLSYSPPVKEEEVCWTEKEDLGLNIVVKEEKEEEDVTVKQEVEGEAVTVKEEEKDVFGMKDEEGEITVTLEEDEEEKTGELINTSKYSFLSSDKERYESQSTYEEVPMKSSSSQSWGLKERHIVVFASALHTADSNDQLIIIKLQVVFIYSFVMPSLI